MIEMSVSISIPYGFHKRFLGPESLQLVKHVVEISSKFSLKT